MNQVANTPKAKSSGRVYKGESHAQRAKERHAKLLDAALEVIGTEGFKAATVRKVCAQAGLTERYYYEAFGNASGMLKQVYEAQVARLTLTLRTAIEAVPGTPRAIAEAALTSMFGAIKKDPRMARVMYIEILGVNDELDSAYQTALSSFEDLVVQYTKPLYPEENVTDLDVKLLASATVGAVTHVARNWVLADFDRSITSMVHTLMNLVIGVFSHLQTRTPD